MKTDVVRRLRDKAKEFAQLDLDTRIRLLEEVKLGYREVAEESVRRSCEAKGIAFDGALAGEEWLSGPVVTVRNIRLLVQSLRDVKARGTPALRPSWLGSLPDGRLSVQVYPQDPLDAALVMGHRAVVHMQPGVTAKNVAEHQASFYRKPHEGRVCVVLGGGNINSIPAVDALYKMFVEGSVVALKTNPINEYLGPLIERAFRGLISAGYFVVVYGGADVGAELIHLPEVDEVHITGSDKTYDLMVWGPAGSEREARKKRNDPLLKKEVTAELGNITPVLVVPGPYTDAELAYQADNVAGMVTLNASFNCNSAKLIITPDEWAQRDKFLGLLERSLGKTPTRKPFYPGAEERWRRFTAGRRGLRLAGKPAPGELPFALVTGIDSSRLDDLAFTEEPWCAVVSETSLPARRPDEFLSRGVRFVNQSVWGTLAASMVIHPKTVRELSAEGLYEKALAELRYGGVAVNCWAGAMFALGSIPWGGHPSSSPADIQSGKGWVHNTFMLEDIEKCVLTGPVKGLTAQPWFPAYRTLAEVGRRILDFEMSPSYLKVPALAALALKA